MLAITKPKIPAFVPFNVISLPGDFFSNPESVGLQNLLLFRYFELLREYLIAANSKTIPLLKRLEEYYIFGTYEIHNSLQTIALYSYCIPLCPNFSATVLVFY